MTAATMQQQTPAVPPRPSRGTDKDATVAPMPKIPPRPASKRIDRSVSPNADRFAPSPFNEGLINKAQAKNLRFSPGWNKEQSDDPIERAGSVPMPSVGEEGLEYSAVADEIEQDDEKPKSRAASPEQTRTVDAGLQLHAPKPSLPAHSAKQRVSAVTRTDSDKAASFGIGRPGGPEERAASRDGLKKKPSTTFSTTSDSGHQTDDEQGIPEIGQRVPMNPHLGDVQAPSPAPGAEGSPRRHHGRKHSARGLPPGSYGLFGHGVSTPQDKLERAYYQKHPELVEKEHHTPLHDRQNDFAMSSSDLNKLVRDTASRGSGAAQLRGTPTDEVGFKASQEYASRMSRPASAVQKDDDRSATPVKQSFQAQVSGPDGEAIHVDDPRHPEYRSYGDIDAAVDDEDHEYNAPILADDEVGKDPSSYLQQPAVHPPPERRGSAFEMEDAPSRPVSRPTSLYKTESQQEFSTTPLEDVEEYEPLFPDETKEEREERLADASKARHHFPSKDIWEDAPNSMHYTAEVSTPDVTETASKRKSQSLEEGSFTPAQAFAQRQEELANKEAQEKKGGRRSESFFPPQEETLKEKPTWVSHQPQLQADRPNMAKRFPSRDVWEDAPESQLFQTTVSSPKEESKPEIPARPAKKSSESSERPSIPSRPKPKQNSTDEGAKPRPVVSDKPKPQIPARPSRSSPSEAAPEASSKPAKPPVPSRPVGGKIAALQAGFMSDLNKRLQLGPQAPKKEEEEEVKEEKEKAPLSDARKSRARGPQRRAPAKSPAPATAAVADAVKPSTPTLSFTTTQTYWAIDPEVGDLAVTEDEPDVPVVEEQAPVAEEKVEQAEDASAQEPEASAEASKIEDDSTAAEPQDTAKSETPDEPLKAAEPEEPTKQETLVANMAGESILEATVEKKAGDEVEPVAVDDEVKP